jgi:serine phosphatase RsbU (regulator of sigma subunit)
VGVVGAPEHRTVLPAGAVLVAYSDGLVERHAADLEEQLHLLRRSVDAAVEPARSATVHSVVDELMGALVPDPDAVSDDVCLLVVRREP